MDGRLDPAGLPIDSTQFDVVQSRDVERDIAEELAEGHVERLTNGGEQLAGGLLLPPFHLGEVAETDPGGTRDVPQCPALVGTSVSEPVTDRLAQQDGHLTRLLSANSTVPRT